MKRRPRLLYSPGRVSAQVARLGRRISRDYRGRPLEVVIILENAMMFGADLIRRIHPPVSCTFVRSEVRDVEFGGHPRREVFFTPQPDLRGRDVLLVDAVLESGVTADFLIKRLQQSRPRSLRLAVLLDKADERKVDVKPDYVCFRPASNYMVGYGLADARGLHRNLPYVGVLRPGPRRKPRGRRRRAGQVR